MSDQGVPAWRSGAAARIAELEAELERWDGAALVAEARIAELEAAKDRPDDVIIIDGQHWRLINPMISTPKFPPRGMAERRLTSMVEPVGDRE